MSLKLESKSFVNRCKRNCNRYIPNQSAAMNQPQSSLNPIQAHVFVSGTVQGVGYRFSTQDMALLLKLSGWVRNLRDGRVEAIFEGPQPQVDEMVRWCHQGPPAAIVKEVSVQYAAPEGLQGFEVRRSG
jgi:acylphosphatase